MECDSCSNNADDEHECPFKSELNDDYTLCNCCDQCTEQCMMDI